MVFSTSPTRDSLSFEDFLDLLSVFSDTATPDIKSHYAFRIFDFDDDGTLDREDLSQLVNCLTGEGEDTRLSASEMKQLIDNILEESDIDRDGTINLSEFQHVISRSPDFARCDRGSCILSTHLLWDGIKGMIQDGLSEDTGDPAHSIFCFFFFLRLILKLCISTHSLDF